jgi:hypothetical protein
MAQRVAIGVAYWLLLMLVLSGRLWRRPRPHGRSDLSL